MVKLLLEQGSEVDLGDISDQIPLWCSAERGCEAVEQLSLNQGAVFVGDLCELITLFTLF